MSRLRIAHLSDPHFGTILPGVREGLLDTLNHLKPQTILLTGDITQRARTSQFREAHEFAKALPPSDFLSVPGNHDIPLMNAFARLFHPYYGFTHYFHKRVEDYVVHGDVRVSCLNSTSRWRHVQGDFNLERIERKLQRITKPAKVHIVAFHHPVDCRKPQDDKNLLKNGEAAMSLFEKQDVDMVIGGHIHDPFVTLSHQRYPNIKRHMVIGVAGTCLSWRTRDDVSNSFNLIDVDTTADPKITVTRYDRKPNFEFAVQQITKFARNAEGTWALF